MKRRLIQIAGGVAATAIVLGAAIAWYFTSQALYPEWQIMDLASCPQRQVEGFGPECGDLRKLDDFAFEDYLAPTDRGYAVPAWYIPALKQKAPPAKANVLGVAPGKYAAIFIHGGGADRRAGTRLARYFIDRGIDYYQPDLVCHGLAECPRPGLSFGYREHQDVVDVYRSIRERYQGVFVIGSSVGANSTLIAFPKMAGVTAVVAENPMYSARRFVLDTGAAPGFFPDWYREILYALLAWRAGIEDHTVSAMSGVVRAAKSGAPLLFIHSTTDHLIPATHSEELHEIFRAEGGTARLEIVEGARHSRIWNAGPEKYEALLDDFFRAAL
ncbi:MAG: prolyl oligopeptidase family serine peptidase [bacterium]|nr:prolyl oligopeptidase family serine peptidase [bacterium]